MQSGGLATIVQMLTVPEEEVRCSAIWLLANLLHEASQDVAKAVMAALSWDQVALLLQDQDIVQVSFVFGILFQYIPTATRAAKPWLTQSWQLYLGTKSPCCCKTRTLLCRSTHYCC